MYDMLLLSMAFISQENPWTSVRVLLQVCCMGHLPEYIILGLIMWPTVHKKTETVLVCLFDIFISNQSRFSWSCKDRKPVLSLNPNQWITLGLKHDQYFN